MPDFTDHSLHPNLIQDQCSLSLWVSVLSGSILDVDPQGKDLGSLISGSPPDTSSSISYRHLHHCTCVCTSVYPVTFCR